MLIYIKKKKILFLFLSFFMVWNIHASEYVPSVYQDDYITVRSVIEEAGRTPVHFGDKLSLVIEAEFSVNEVIVENIDEQLFERSWGSEKGIRLISSPTLSQIDNENGRTVSRSTYSFQVIDCPGELTSCRGNKIYEVPTFTLGYQIIDGVGNVVNNKSVRFNPVPDNVVVMQSLDIRGEGDLAKLSDYLGNGGYPSSEEFSQDEGGGLWLLVGGGFIFMISFFPLLLTKNTYRKIDSDNLRRRWERALVYIDNQSDELSDEEWSDLLRRSVTWYCQDELSINPYVWLTDEHGIAEDAGTVDLKKYFLEVLNKEGINKQQRLSFLGRFKDLLKEAGYTG